MCYHISTPTAETIESLLPYEVTSDELVTQYDHLSGFAHAKIPVLTLENPKQIQAFKWGLIPSWCKDEKQAKEMATMTLNAKSETAFEKPSFRSSIMKKRCLIFVNGFFEWRDYNKKKYPYFIKLKNQDAFALGGIYENWVNRESGEIFNTCSIVTTEANKLMAEIHNSKKRMPVIFPKDKMMNWINPKLSKEEIVELEKPLEEGMLDAHTISKLITSRTENSNVSEVKNEFGYDELPKL